MRTDCRLCYNCRATIPLIYPTGKNNLLWGRFILYPDQNTLCQGKLDCGGNGEREGVSEPKHVYEDCAGV